MNTKRILVRNIPSDKSRNETLEGLKKLLGGLSTSAIITIPASIPNDIDMTKYPNSNIALLSVQDISKMPNILQLLNNKTFGSNKLLVEYYTIKPSTVVAALAKKPAPAPTTTTTTAPASTTTSSTQQQQSKTLSSSSSNNKSSTTTSTTTTTTTNKKEVDQQQQQQTEKKKDNNNNKRKEKEENNSNTINETKQPVKKVKVDNNNNNKKKEEEVKQQQVNQKKEDKEEEENVEDEEENNDDNVDGDKDEQEEEVEEDGDNTTTENEINKKKNNNNKKNKNDNDNNNDEKKKKQLQPIKNKKKVLMMITKQMSEHIEKRNFVKFRQAYNYLRDHELELDHLAYGIVLNACVRFQEWEMEKLVFQHILESKAGPNEVIYTTHIKALCETQMDKTEALLDDMEKNGVQPNTRTLNSILRGCVRDGNRVIADRIYQRAVSKKIEDASTVEYMIKVYTQHLKINDCWNILTSKFEQMEESLSPAIFSRLSLGSLMIGDLKSATRALSIVDDLMARAPQSVAKSINSHRDKGKKSDENKISAGLFERITRQEINEESDRVRGYLLKLKSGDLSKKVKMVSMETSSSIHFSPTTFSHIYQDNPDMLENKYFINKLFFNRQQLPQQQQQPTADNNNNYKINISGNQFINHNQNRLVKMEICSGHGHWIMERAKRDLDSDWVSVEIRYDRVFQIWTKKVLEDIDNLYILAGEAHSTIKTNVPDASVDELYINYPNPPMWYGAKRLIDEPFLKELNRILKRDGTLTIVTDNREYSEAVVRQLQTSKPLKKIYAPAQNNDYLADLPEEYGYSYFNKLWSNGQRIKRYCVYAIKKK